jgi:hypothetical protein
MTSHFGSLGDLRWAAGWDVAEAGPRPKPSEGRPGDGEVLAAVGVDGLVGLEGKAEVASVGSEGAVPVGDAKAQGWDVGDVGSAEVLVGGVVVDAVDVVHDGLADGDGHVLHPDGEPVAVVEVLQIWVPVGSLTSSKLVVGGERWAWGSGSPSQAGQMKWAISEGGEGWRSWRLVSLKTSRMH